MAYIKVTPAVAAALNLTATRNQTADGNYILWQADIAGIPGDLLTDRAAAVGGIVLTPNDAKKEIDGLANPVEVTTPAKYLPGGEAMKDETIESVDQPADQPANNEVV